MVYQATTAPLYVASIDGPSRVGPDALLRSWRNALEQQARAQTDSTIIDITERLQEKRNREDTERLAAVIKRFDPAVQFVPREK